MMLRRSGFRGFQTEFKRGKSVQIKKNLAEWVFTWKFGLDTAESEPFEVCFSFIRGSNMAVSGGATLLERQNDHMDIFLPRLATFQSPPFGINVL